MNEHKDDVTASCGLCSKSKHQINISEIRCSASDSLMSHNIYAPFNNKKPLKLTMSNKNKTVLNQNKSSFL